MPIRSSRSRGGTASRCAPGFRDGVMCENRRRSRRRCGFLSIVGTLLDGGDAESELAGICCCSVWLICCACLSYKEKSIFHYACAISCRFLAVLCFVLRVEEPWRAEHIV